MKKGLSDRYFYNPFSPLSKSFKNELIKKEDTLVSSSLINKHRHFFQFDNA